MKSRWNICLPALLLAVFVVPALAAQDASSAAKAADSAAYQRWLTSTAKTLASSDDADALLMAALLQKAASKHGVYLMDRAAAREPGAADLAAMAMTMCLDVPTCDVKAHVASYRRIAPTDAFGWWPALQQAEAAKDQAAVTESLLAMSRAETFNDYFVGYFQRLRRGLGDAPPVPLPSTPSPTFDAASADDVRAIDAMAFASAIAMPQYATVANPCRPDNPQFAQRRTACFAIGELMQHSARSRISYQIGLALQRRAADTDAERQHALAAGRRADWQLLNYEKLTPNWSQSGAAAQLRDYFDALERTGSEISATQQLLQKAGLPLDPPSDWVDKRQQAQLASERHMRDAQPQ